MLQHLEATTLNPKAEVTATIAKPICPLNPIITRPSPVKQSDSYTNSIITRPSPTVHQPESQVNPTITRPSPASPA